MSDPIDISIITASYNLLKSGRKEKNYTLLREYPCSEKCQI